MSRGMIRSGFTLLELVVTMAVVSLVVLAAYQLFASTSEAMYEADSLADTTDRARFSLEMMSREVRSAGAFGTPDGTLDEFVHRAQLNGNVVQGIYAYQSQNARKIAPIQSSYNMATRSDQIILLGAYDFPFTFEVSFPLGDTFATGFVPNTQRGALRFLDLDPFNTKLQDALDIGNVSNSLMGPAGPTDTTYLTSRVLRVRDRNGFVQFSPIIGGVYEAGVGKGLTMTLDPMTMPLRPRQADERQGLEPGGETDVAYEGALLDAYRYRVCRPDGDDRQLVLVRERLDAAQLITRVLPPVGDSCNSAAIGPGNYIVEQHVIADGVVDFQVWYDCGTMVPDMAGGMDFLFENRGWFAGWMAPDGDDAAVSAPNQHTCMHMDDTGQIPNSLHAGQARMAHIRLSVRTENERRDLVNYGFVLADGTTLNASTATNASEFITSTTAPPVGDLAVNVVGPLHTVDVDGDPSSAARVVTMQIDVQLTNYINMTKVMSREEINDGRYR